jgi:hypothetical protein
MKYPLFFFALLFATELSAQSRSLLSQDASASWQNAQAIYASPLHYSRLQWLTVAGVLSLTAGSHFLDESARSFARAHHTSTLNLIFSIGEFYGNPICAGLIGGGLFSADFPAATPQRALPAERFWNPSFTPPFSHKS